MPSISNTSNNYIEGNADYTAVTVSNNALPANYGNYQFINYGNYGVQTMQTSQSGAVSNEGIDLNLGTLASNVFEYQRQALYFEQISNLNKTFIVASALKGQSTQ